MGGVDTALILSRRKGAEGAVKGRELMSIQREGESLDPVVITLSEQTGWPQNIGRAQEFVIESGKKMIREALLEVDELGASELQGVAGIRGKTYGNARKAMLDSGELILRTQGKRKFYSLG